MGIYIPGMDMPTEGGTIVVYKISGNYFAARAGKNELCPLVPVPKHGRLIDGDAMVKSVMSQYDMIKAFNNSELSEIADILVRGVLQEIENAPTIIPTSEGKENE